MQRTEEKAGHSGAWSRCGAQAGLPLGGVAPGLSLVLAQDSNVGSLSRLQWDLRRRKGERPGLGSWAKAQD